MTQQSTEFPLDALLRLYVTGRKKLYLNYMEDFILLVKWIGPTEHPQDNTLPKLQWYQQNYEVDRIAAILSIRPELVLYYLERIYSNEC